MNHLAMVFVVGLHLLAQQVQVQYSFDTGPDNCILLQGEINNIETKEKPGNMYF